MRTSSFLIAFLLTTITTAQSNTIKALNGIVDKVKSIVDTVNSAASKERLGGVLDDLKRAIDVSSKEGADSLSIFDPETSDFGWKDKISFVFGAGPSYLLEDAYLAPVVDKSTNRVKVDKDIRMRANASFGITYTPVLRTYIRSVPVAINGRTAYKNLYNYAPAGWSFGLFMNPISVSETGSVNLAKSFDVGLGVGYRSSSNFSIYGTLEWYRLKQPRPSFVQHYASGDSTYRVNGAPQTTLDLEDNSIFEDRTFVAVGIKMCYSFGTVKRFAQISTENKANVAEKGPEGNASSGTPCPLKEWKHVNQEIPPEQPFEISENDKCWVDANVRVKANLIINPANGGFKWNVSMVTVTVNGRQIKTQSKPAPDDQPISIQLNELIKADATGKVAFQLKYSGLLYDGANGGSLTLRQQSELTFEKE